MTRSDESMHLHDTGTRPIDARDSLNCRAERRGATERRNGQQIEESVWNEGE